MIITLEHHDRLILLRIIAAEIRFMQRCAQSSVPENESKNFQFEVQRLGALYKRVNEAS